jgi:two-component system CheB/CheR fusion protein
VRHVEVRCSPLKLAIEAGASESVAILVSDTTSTVEHRRELEQTYAQQRDETDRPNAQVQRLAESNRQLLVANQELANANSELRGTNEELLVGYEEAQAATEEAEVLNEELETLNEELQATVEELDTTTGDLQARGQELQVLAASLEEQRRASEEERTRLEAILANMGDAVLVVDRQARPVLTNAAFQELLGSADFVPLDEEGQPLPADAWPQRRAAQGESFNTQFTITAAETGRRWFEASGQPIGRAGAESGGVVVLHDITDRSLRRLLEEFMALASHELRSPLTSISMLSQLVERHVQQRLEQGQPGEEEWEQEQRAPRAAKGAPGPVRKACASGR